jgi:parvulin-like peptidyl-prolyl isomerase
VGLFGSVTPSYALTADKVLATVNNEVIKSSDYQRFVESIGTMENKDVVDRDLLKRLIKEKIILHEAIRNGIEASDVEIDKGIEEFKKQDALYQEDFEKALAQDGMSIDNFRKFIKDKIISSKLVSINVYSKVVISDKEIEGFYNANKKDYLIEPEKVELKAIFLSLREGASVTELTDIKLKALKIVSCLKDGNSFERLVKQYSDEPLRSQGGMLGKFTRGILIPPLDNKAFSMKNGEISEPIKVNEGVYILQLINKTNESFKSIEEVKEEIRSYLYEQEKEKLFNTWMNELWKKASVIIK